jgi:hypothetical protein
MHCKQLLQLEISLKSESYISYTKPNVSFYVKIAIFFF